MKVMKMKRKVKILLGSIIALNILLAVGLGIYLFTPPYPAPEGYRWAKCPVQENHQGYNVIYNDGEWYLYGPVTPVTSGLGAEMLIRILIPIIGVVLAAAIILYYEVLGKAAVPI